MTGSGDVTEMDHDDLFDDDLLREPDAARPSARRRATRVATAPADRVAPQDAEEPTQPVEQPHLVEPVEHVAGVDVLEDPGLRQRIRSSRFGTLVVLLVTAALVAGGVWLVNGGRGDAATAAGTTVVTLPGTSTVPAPRVGAPAQDFTLTTVDGKTVSLSQLRGKAVWIVFGASWCAACQAEVADIQAAYAKYAPQGLVVLGVNIDEGPDAVRAYASRVGTTYPVGADAQSAIADAYRVSAIPAHFYVDRSGVLREMRQGGVSTDGIDTSVGRVLAP
jgi:cytochrome c biogenesis protein CcmG/thiol:disulfide interchange protein DsbE